MLTQVMSASFKTDVACEQALYVEVEVCVKVLKYP